MEKRKHGSAEARVSTLVAEAPDVAAPRADACATLRRAGRLARPSMTARARARFGAPRLKNAVRSGNMLPSGDDRNNPKWPDTLSETTRERRRRRVPRSAFELVHACMATGCPQRLSSARLGRGWCPKSYFVRRFVPRSTWKVYLERKSRFRRAEAGPKCRENIYEPGGKKITRIRVRTRALRWNGENEFAIYPF